MPGPFNRSYTYYQTTAGGVNSPKEQLSQTWYTSGRGPNGKLNLQPQPFSRSLRRNVTLVQRSNTDGLYVTPPLMGVVTSNEPEISAAYESLYNQAYARFWSKVKGDSASLGISLVQWRQTWSMVSGRLGTVTKLAKKAFDVHKARVARSKGRDKGPSSANLFLEYKFGWVPALQDIHDGLRALTDDIPPGWCSGRARTRLVLPNGVYNQYRKETGRSANCSVTLSAKVDVANQNLWLANKLGLINPASVAWDAVPWSFVVGMFANVNQVLSSFTNDVGLSITQISDTRTTELFDSVWISNTFPSSHPFYAYASASALQRYKSRSVGPFSRPTLQARLPKLDMDLGLTASALLMQQLSRLRK